MTLTLASAPPPRILVSFVATAGRNGRWGVPRHLLLLHAALPVARSQPVPFAGTVTGAMLLALVAVGG